MLLGLEAKAMGLGSNVAAVRGTSASPTQDIELVAHRLRVKPTIIYEALAEYKAVADATMAIGAAALPSEAEVRTAARDALEKAKVRAAVLPAQAFEDANATFSDEELQAHFQKYKDKERGEGLSFGYYLPAKLQVQYVEINRDAIADQINIPNPERKAKEFYEKNKMTQAFRRNPEEMAKLREEYEASKTESGETPFVAPSEFLSWDEAKPLAMTLAKKDEADQKATQLATWMVQYADEPWLATTRGKSGYRPAPEGAKDEAFYQEMLKHIPSTLNFAGAVTVKTTDFFAPDAASAIPGIGLARFDAEGAAPRMFPSLAMKNEALVPQVPEGMAPDSFLATFQTSRIPVRNTQTGNYYVFRVVGSQPAHAPETVDEVRDQVVADLRLLKGFEEAKKQAQAVLASLPATPLQQATEADAKLSKFKTENTSIAAGYYEPEPFPRVSRYQVAGGRPADGSYVGAGIGKLPNDVIDGVFELPQAEAKAGVFELPGRAAVLVVEGVELVRAVEDEMKTLKDELETQMADARWREAVASWLDRKAIQARTGFEFVTN
jgi:hypothetical protein